jgi:hypothetical protein
VAKDGRQMDSLSWDGPQKKEERMKNSAMYFLGILLAIGTAGSVEAGPSKKSTALPHVKLSRNVEPVGEEEFELACENHSLGKPNTECEIKKTATGVPSLSTRVGLKDARAWVEKFIKKLPTQNAGSSTEGETALQWEVSLGSQKLRGAVSRLEAEKTDEEITRRIDAIYGLEAEMQTALDNATAWKKN